MNTAFQLMSLDESYRLQALAALEKGSVQIHRRVQTVIHEKAAGGYYYLVVQAPCQLMRLFAGDIVAVTELNTGNAVGEEVLVENLEMAVQMSAQSADARFPAEAFQEEGLPGASTCH